MEPQAQLDATPVGPLTRGQLKQIINETFLATLASLADAEQRAAQAQAALEPVRSDMFLGGAGAPPRAAGGGAVVGRPLAAAPGAPSPAVD